MTSVGELFPGDKERRFCSGRLFIEQRNNQSTLPMDIKYSDESTSYLHPPRSLPHSIVRDAKYNPRGEAWCAIHGRTVLGPIFCSNKMNGLDHLQLLKETLGAYIDNMPSARRYRFCFHQDGAPMHTAQPLTD